ncbi:triose-phosphate isomerase [Candidatus Nomurabacteria bacterium]|nr:triose-phosphate isomerase [Candidatus Nomurabacteria bacterium]
MGKRALIIGNWKMNFTVQQASIYVLKLNEAIKKRTNVEVSIAPTSLCLQPLSLQVDRYKMSLTAQNFYWRDEGAFTGEVSAQQLRGLVKYAIIGHSERRHLFGEPEKSIRNKVQAAVRNGITPVLCVGETAIERSEGEASDILHGQVISGLANLTAEEAKDMVIAYEPVWAIGTGNQATPNDLRQAVRVIRRNIENLFGKKTSETIRILYGGSVTTSNTTDLLMVNGVDGLLIGGASLRLEEFSSIIEIAHNVYSRKD